MITYHKGDATRPVGDGYKIICHICNNAGGWGAGFVLAVSARWSKPEQSYRKLFQTKTKPALGSVYIVPVEEEIAVANMIAQDGFGDSEGPPIRYAALHECLTELASLPHVSFHMPRIGCGLAGGSWDEVEKIIQQTLIAKGHAVHVYDL